MTIGALRDWNYTTNIDPMLRKAGMTTLRDLDGLSGAEAAQRIARLIAAFKDDPDGYRALNPPNGWGDFDRFVDRLCELQDACALAPFDHVHVYA